MAQKKTRKLLKKLLKSDSKRSMYSRPELLYMERMYENLKVAHKRQKLQKKKGFDPSKHDEPVDGREKMD